MSRWAIPDHWEWTTIETIAEVLAGGTPNASDGGNFSDQGTPWITPADLTGYKQPTIQRGRRGLSEKGMKASSAKLLPAGAVLFSSRAPIGYCVVAANPIATNQGFKNLILRGGIDPHYVRLYLIASKEYAESQASGTTFPELSAARMKLLSFPLPPLAEQRRIVAKVEELTARSRAARAALAEVPTLLEQFRQSVLASAFRGDLTADWRAKNPNAEPASALLDRIRAGRRKQWEAKYPKKNYAAPEPVDDDDLPELPEGWEYARADEIVATGTVITYGIVLPGDPIDGGVPYVRGQDIEDGRILVDQLARTKPEIAARHDRSSLQQGDVLLCIIRHLKVAIVPAGIDGANLTQGTVRLRPSEVILGPYLAAYLAGPTAQAWMKERYFGMAMPRINVEDARAIPIPIAPIEEQREIIRQLESGEHRRTTALAEVTQALDESGGLDQSILAKAFCGELVPQDPADEPATALLARIRSGGSATRSVERGRVKFYILLLLRTWNKPLGREMLERGLVLMLNADVRRAILGRSKPAPKRGKKPSTPPRFVTGLDVFFGEMLDDGDLVPGPEAGFFAEGRHGIDFAAAPKADLDAVRETAEAMKVIHKDKLQATDAEFERALNGEVYELVS